MFHTFIHLSLHLLIPAGVAKRWYSNRFWPAWGIMIAAMAVDLDHLLANPVFDPNRCSIGFHPLHSIAAVGAYLLLALVPASKWLRLAGIGLLIHMGVDGADCLRMK
ncbi:MAG: DUF6122 family protein [Thermodesulfobacteriota bacterium]